MNSLTLELPDTKYQRLQQLAESKGTTVKHLLEEVTTRILADADLKTQFEARASRGQGKAERGLALLEQAKSKT